MKEKVLVLASVASMIDQFNMPNLELLQSLGYEVHVACNFEKGNTCSNEKIIGLKKKLDIMNVIVYQIDFTRSVFDLKQDIIAYKQVKAIMEKNKYKFIHCHSPIGGVIGRLVCKVTKIKCIYTAHGFHFYTGASFKNWILFYPIEKWLSKYTDVLITINEEDYSRAKKKFKSKKNIYIPGVGIDVNKIENSKSIRNNLCKELGISNDSFLLLSVGELSQRKNHQIIIRSLAHLPENIHYLIVGKGNEKERLIQLSKEQNVYKRVHFLGFRNNVFEIMKSCDIFIFPSLQEGLPVALMECMSANVPCIVSKIRGNIDLLYNYEKECIVNEIMNEKEWSKKINNFYQHKPQINYSMEKFSTANINKLMFDLYKKIDDDNNCIG